MAFVSGTATNYRDLLDRLRTFLTANATLVGAGQNWQALDYKQGRIKQMSAATRDSSSFDAVNAADENQVSFWRTASGASRVPTWLMAQLHAAEAVTRFELSAAQADNARMPRDFQLEWSDNGSTWTVAASFTNQAGWTALETRSFNTGLGAGDTHLYWRLYVSANNGDSSYTHVAELKLFDAGNVRIRLPRELHLKGPGLAASDEIFVSIRAFEDAAADWFNWGIQGAVGFDANLDFQGQPGAGADVYMHLWNDAIPYWFVANGRRFIVVAKVSTVYQACYGGLFLPYGTPAQYPYPIMIGGSSSNEAWRWSQIQDANHRHFTDPGEFSLRVRYTDGAWHSFANWYFTSSRQPRTDRNVWPYMPEYLLLDDVREAVDGSYPLLPLILTMADGQPARNVLGEIDGCFYVSGFGNAAENLITSGGVDHLVVQNVYMTSIRDYWALKLA
jgi:hypothetical protein